ncbi:MAG: 2-iminoacetate synthase ThiH [Phycisphaerales bacterium]|nr:MAG: 2-iminoacetate synthase ThiH [Phycisphaerales bacterium]
MTTRIAERHAGSQIGTLLAETGLGADRDLWQRRLEQVTAEDVEAALQSKPGSYSIDRLLALVSPAAEDYVEQMAQQSQRLTIQRFGRTIRLYAPLYLSNYCVNSCQYCGFNRDSKFDRVRLTIEQALAEADVIASEGFSDILLVSSEDRESMTMEYFTELAARLRGKFSFIAAEVYQMTSDEYATLFAAGIEGVTLYQETYNRDTYSRYHTGGPKSDYDMRLRGPDDMARAGMREIGLGVLLGLANWRLEALALAEHAHYLIRRYWQSHVSFSFPRLRPAPQVDTVKFKHLLSDRELVQMILALRLCFADAGLVLSTREPAGLRDHLVRLGITKLSAGSRTNPGGYSGRGKATEQFRVDDSRTPAQVASMLRKQGLEPIWKDWDRGFSQP